MSNRSDVVDPGRVERLGDDPHGMEARASAGEARPCKRTDIFTASNSSAASAGMGFSEFPTSERTTMMNQWAISVMLTAFFFSMPDIEFFKKGA